MEMFLSSLLAVLTDPAILLCIFIGVVLGFVFGALPGLTATLGVALLTPLTFPLPPEQAIAMMSALYCGSMTGGSIPAILLKIPGTPSAVVTTLDGYPMTQRGEALRAYGWALSASVCGGLVSWLCLATIAPFLARLAMRIGPAEYAMLALMGMTVIASITPGRVLKGLAGALIGVGLSVVGFDQITGEGRWIFQSIALSGGVSVMPALIGFLVIPELISTLGLKAQRINTKVDLRAILPPVADMLRQKWNYLRSALIGVGIGIVPALGGNVAAFISYDQAKRFDSRGKNYGRGEPGGIIASEASNNGVTGGALIPLLTLGIPGDSVTAMLLGGLMIHGIQPGPRLFETSGPLVWTIICALLAANVIIALVGFFGIGGFFQALRVPKSLLSPCLLILTVIGTYALSGQIFDVIIMLCLGLFGFLCLLAEFPVYPMVIGIILGPLLEAELRRALVISGGDWSIFLTRPVSAIFLAMTVLALVVPTLIARWKKRGKAPCPPGVV
ncbi:MAG: tripartite tricarboxylate transporter permease [Desulfovibrio sp.]|jgi:putative tricarboxylic transport membrane protein|nr:tripartite tricarboxylate transporter permease [Desulfovibrio sp.]